MSATGPHELIKPDAGFSHVAKAAPGKMVTVAGQIGAGDTIVEQFGGAARNVVAALAAGGAEPHHVVWLQIFVTDVDAYVAAREEIGAVYRDAFGRHFPPMGLFGVTRLVDPAALVELMALAVVPDP
ncbi:MAG: RidA family protein [Acidimicrobiales bacterium]